MEKYKFKVGDRVRITRIDDLVYYGMAHIVLMILVQLYHNIELTKVIPMLLNLTD